MNKNSYLTNETCYSFERRAFNLHRVPLPREKKKKILGEMRTILMSMLSPEVKIRDKLA